MSGPNNSLVGSRKEGSARKSEGNVPASRFRKGGRSRGVSQPPAIQRHRKNSRTCCEGPFAEVLHGTGPMAKANPIRFSTKYHDDETGLLYYGYRYYSVSTGTWISRDPIGERGSINLYEFCRNGPLKFYDPHGLAVDLCCGVKIARAAWTPAQRFYTGPGADAAWHCYVGCAIAHGCNQETATAAGVFQEVQSLLRANAGQAESRDYYNTRIGAEQCGLTGGCRSCCQKLWDDGELF